MAWKGLWLDTEKYGKIRENWVPKMVVMTVGGCWEVRGGKKKLYAQIWNLFSSKTKAETRSETKSPYKEVSEARWGKANRVESRHNRGIEKQRKTERKQTRFGEKMYRYVRKRAETISRDWESDFSSHPPRDLPRRGNHQNIDEKIIARFT